jgi:ribosomal protein S21
MPAKVMVAEGEELSKALRRFRQQMSMVYGRPWTKRRFGYFEKPSVLHCKRKRMAWRQRQAGGCLKLHIGLREQLDRTGPSNALGR